LQFITAEGSRPALLWDFRPLSPNIPDSNICLQRLQEKGETLFRLHPTADHSSLAVPTRNFSTPEDNMKTKSIPNAEDQVYLKGSNKQFEGPLYDLELSC
jgi:hypothetical protein